MRIYAAIALLVSLPMRSADCYLRVVGKCKVKAYDRPQYASWWPSSPGKPSLESCQRQQRSWQATCGPDARVEHVYRKNKGESPLAMPEAALPSPMTSRSMLPDEQMAPEDHRHSPPDHSCSPLDAFVGTHKAIRSAAAFHRGGGSLQVQAALLNQGTKKDWNEGRGDLPPKLPPWKCDRSRGQACYFDSAGPIGPFCRSNMTTFGAGDEEKRFCLVHRQQAKAARVLFSIGSNDQWQFETTAILNGAFDHVHVFDCTLPGDGLPKAMPKSIEAHVTFHPYCLAKKPHEEPAMDGKPRKRYTTYESLVRMAGVGSAPELLKMDVEGWEWEVLQTITSGPRRQRPRQIAFELHVVTWAPKYHIAPPDFWRAKTPGEVAALMAGLFERGYLLIDRRDNDECHTCTEIVVADVCERPS